MTVLDTIQVGEESYEVRVADAAALTPVFDVQERAATLYERRKAGDASQRDTIEARTDQQLTAACIEVATGAENGKELMVRAAYLEDVPYNESRLAVACLHACGVGGHSKRLGKAIGRLMSKDEK